MIWFGVLSIIHGILPAVVPFETAKYIMRTYWKVLHNHPAPEIKKEYFKIRSECIQSEFDKL